MNQLASLKASPVIVAPSLMWGSPSPAFAFAAEEDGVAGKIPLERALQLQLVMRQVGQNKVGLDVSAHPTTSDGTGATAGHANWWPRARTRPPSLNAAEADGTNPETMSYGQWARYVRRKVRIKAARPPLHECPRQMAS